MPLNQKERKWYSQIMECCFPPEENVSDVSFLKIFASMTCAPCNRNYGRNEGDRRRGAANADNCRQPEEIRIDQRKLLDQFSGFLDDWTSEKPLKSRMVDLADELSNKFLYSEREYTKKNSNYKPHHYLSLYRNVPETETAEDFERMCIFYSKALETIYGTKEACMGPQCRTLKEMVSQELPQYQETETGDTAKDMGKHLAVALMCAAGKEGLDCACRILGIELPEQEATLSVFPLGQVVLKIAQFNRICTAALRADMEPEELQAVQQILESIWTVTDGNPDGETRMLAEGLEAAAQKCLERLTGALVTVRSPDKSAALVQKLTAVTCIRNKCQEWLR